MVGQVEVVGQLEVVVPCTFPELLAAGLSIYTVFEPLEPPTAPH